LFFRRAGEILRGSGVPVATRTTPPPKLSENERAAFIEKVKAIAPEYRTELLREA